MPEPSPSPSQVVEILRASHEAALRAERALQASLSAAADARDAREAVTRVHAVEVRLTSLEARITPSGPWALAHRVVDRLPAGHLAVVVAVVAVAVVAISARAPQLILSWISGVTAP